MDTSTTPVRLFSLTALLATACGPSLEAMHARAMNGDVQQDAPLHAHRDIRRTGIAGACASQGATSIASTVTGATEQACAGTDCAVLSASHPPTHGRPGRGALHPARPNGKSRDRR